MRPKGGPRPLPKKKSEYRFTNGPISCRILSWNTEEEAGPTNGYILHLPEEESVVLSGPVARRLIEGGDGDAALLYIAVLRNRGGVDDQQLRAQLAWDEVRFRRALDALVRQGLVSLPRGAAAQAPEEKPLPAPPEEKPAYTRADLARALEGAEFRSLTGAVEEKLGKKLTTPDVATLLGLYDQLGLPADVIFLLVGFCTERTVKQYGQGRRPTLRQIEREGYVWARQGLMTQESAAAYIKNDQRRREALPQMMRLLRLGDRRPSSTEEKYLMEWSAMGFEPEALEAAYDRTILKCKELKWPYMNRILASWHEKGLHTLAEVEAGDAPRASGSRPASGRRPASGQSGRDASMREDMARMEKYRQQLRREKEGT